MTFLISAWSFLKKIPGWIWAVLLLVLAVLIPGVGWWKERKAHGETKRERDAERARADRAAEAYVLTNESLATERAAYEEWKAKQRELDLKVEEATEREEAVEERIDEHAGDVGAVADDINAELGLE